MSPDGTAEYVCTEMCILKYVPVHLRGGGGGRARLSGVEEGWQRGDSADDSTAIN